MGEGEVKQIEKQRCYSVMTNIHNRKIQRKKQKVIIFLWILKLQMGEKNVVTDLKIIQKLDLWDAMTNLYKTWRQEKMKKAGEKLFW